MGQEKTSAWEPLNSSHSTHWGWGGARFSPSPQFTGCSGLSLSAAVADTWVSASSCPATWVHGRRGSSCLGGAGGRVAPWQERGVRQLPGSHAISSVANCSHSFAFPSGLPVSCAPHVVSIKVRVGEGKHVNYCSIYSHWSCQSWEHLWHKGCRELQAGHRDRLQC